MPDLPPNHDQQSWDEAIVRLWREAWQRQYEERLEQARANHHSGTFLPYAGFTSQEITELEAQREQPRRPSVTELWRRLFYRETIGTESFPMTDMPRGFKDLNSMTEEEIDAHITAAEERLTKRINSRHHTGAPVLPGPEYTQRNGFGDQARMVENAASHNPTDGATRENIIAHDEQYLSDLDNGREEW